MRKVAIPLPTLGVWVGKSNYTVKRRGCRNSGADLPQRVCDWLAGMTDRQAWSRIERGHTAITLDTLEKIATALGVKGKDLLK